MACAHVQMCVGIDPCNFMMFDCSDPQNDCIAKCVINTPCNMLNMSTFTTCSNMCSGDGGAMDGGMSDGGGAQACQTCATNQCQAEAFACFSDAQCMGWLNCIQGCGNQPNPAACANACDTMYSSAAGLYGPIYSCTCNKCTSECKDIDPCSHVAG